MIWTRIGKNQINVLKVECRKTDVFCCCCCCSIVLYLQEQLSKYYGLPYVLVL